jgi:hypothetical protein
MSRHPSAERPPEPGDLFVFAETAGFPIEWAVLDVQAGGHGELLAVPADTNPLAGSADVEVPAGEPGGPLNLRCRFALRLDALRFDPARRTGALESEAIARALRKRADLESGEVHASPLAYEADADPEYEDWVREVLVPAHAALSQPAAEDVRPTQASVVQPLRWTTLGNPYALAASILLMVTLGLAGGLLWQTRRISDLAGERRRTEEEHRRDRERFAGKLRKAEEEHRREIVERDRQAAARIQEDRERIADLEKRLNDAGRVQPLVNSPFVWLSPKDPVRGDPDVVPLPPGARYLFLILTVADLQPYPEYRLEIQKKDTGKAVWNASGLHQTGTLAVSVALPRDLLPPGDYRLRLFGLREGKAQTVGEYEMRIGEE